MYSSHVDSILSKLNKFLDSSSGILRSNDRRKTRRLIKGTNFDWPPLTIGDISAPTPIIQGGMGVGVSLAGLASAVANAGGIGVIAANGIGMLDPNYFKDGRNANLRAFRKEIKAARQKTDGIIGVNIMVAIDDFHQLLEVAIEEGVDIIIMGAGLPIKDIPVEHMRKNGVKAVPIVSSARAAEIIFRMWEKMYGDVPDAVIFEGPLAGGHIGFAADEIDDASFQLESIVPAVVSVLKQYEDRFDRKIPTIAAGGIYTGEDILAALKLGAAGVQMGTRFVATHECDADLEFKNTYVNSSRDIGIIKSPVGMLGRAIRNKFISDSERGVRPSFSCAWKCLASCKAESAQYCISIALNSARRGNMKHGFAFAGANAYRVEKIVSVSELIQELRSSFLAKVQESFAVKLDILVANIKMLSSQHDTAGSRLRQIGYSVTRAVDSSQATVLKARIKDLRSQIKNTLIECWRQLDPKKAT